MSTLFATATSTEIAFVVYGTPVPQGSTKAFIPKGWSKPVITNDNIKTKPWRQQIADTALSLNVLMFDRDVPVGLDLDFYFTRPKSAKKRRGMTIRPDRDKCERAVCDALTGILYVDDAQIVEGYTRKHYCEPGQPERVEIRVREVV